MESFHWIVCYDRSYCYGKSYRYNNLYCNGHRWNGMLEYEIGNGYR